MSVAFQRGIVLYGQGRYDLADKEFRQSLAEDPENGLAHAYLSLCLSSLDRHAEALAEADEAIRVDPGEGFPHHVRGRALLGNDRYREAEAEAMQAVELEPTDADNRALLSAIFCARRQWQAALDAANAGLELDAEHSECRNLRGMALVQLGRNAEAAHSFGSALADDPENAITHANQGWNLLHQANYKGALEHFREALRLDPNLEYARIGIIEALKAHHFVYRTMLRFFLWMSRQSQIAQTAIILGMVFGRQALAHIEKAYPAFAPFTTPILALSFGFIVLTWVAGPVFNFLLMFNRFGRLALKPAEKLEAGVIGGSLTLATGFFIANTIKSSDPTFVPMLFFGLMLFPLAVMFRQKSGRGRLIMLAFVATMFVVYIPAFSHILLPSSSPFTWDQTEQGLMIFIYGCMFSTWIPMLLGWREAAR